ncbi:MAG: hypothetical protein PHE09_10755 [Oscillospiraceae bacterium]|nr:hypothetical protein [Oscillospiraceae bacterium]
MENRCGTCPDCGGWLIADEATDYISCDTCEAEWQDGKRADLKGMLKERIAASAIRVSTVKLPHTYMKAVGTKELDRIIEEVFDNV